MNKKKNNNSQIKFRAPYKSGKYHIFPTPNILNIYNEESYESTVRYINSLDSIIKNKYKYVIISFADCEYIKAAAMMILYAKIETILKKSDVNISIKMSLNNEINKFIKQVGLVFLCTNRCSENDIRKTKDDYPIINGNEGEFRDDIIDFIKNEIYQGALTDEEEYTLSDAIQEAMSNVYRHAYPKHTPSNQRPWWWMCTVVDDQLFLLLYDKGQGIPSTFTKGNTLFDEIDWDRSDVKSAITPKLKQYGLPESTNIAEVIKNTTVSDSIMISLAMSDDITRMTGNDEDKHGQGSKSIKKLVSDNKNGKLWVYSNRGLFFYQDDRTLPELYNMRNSIEGTLVQWNIRIKND